MTTASGESEVDTNPGSRPAGGGPGRWVEIIHREVGGHRIGSIVSEAEAPCVVDIEDGLRRERGRLEPRGVREIHDNGYLEVIVTRSYNPEVLVAVVELFNNHVMADVGD